MPGLGYARVNSMFMGWFSHGTLILFLKYMPKFRLIISAFCWLKLLQNRPSRFGDKPEQTVFFCYNYLSLS